MPRRPSEEEIELGLVSLATYGPTEASRRTDIHEATLRSWAKRYPERYAEIREQEAPKWRARAAATFEDLTDRSTNLAHKLLDQAEKDLEEGNLEPKDYIALTKSIVYNAGVSTDKSEKLRDRPAQVVEHRFDIDRVAKTLARWDVESTAVEDTTPQLEQGEQG